jgi:hypothetical protein
MVNNVLADTSQNFTSDCPESTTAYNEKVCPDSFTLFYNCMSRISSF